MIATVLLLMATTPAASAEMLDVRRRGGAENYFERIGLSFRNNTDEAHVFRICPDSVAFQVTPTGPVIGSNVQPSGVQTAYAVSFDHQSDWSTECVERSVGAGQAVRVNVFVQSALLGTGRRVMRASTSFGDFTFVPPESLAAR